MNRFFVVLLLAGMAGWQAVAQTAFVGFDTPGQLGANFNVWNDVGGTDGGNYDYQESTNSGVGGSGGITVFQDSDTTASYKGTTWNFATNGAVIVLSTLIKANDLASGNKIQLGILNPAPEGLNNNAGVSFESFRFIPAGSLNWTVREQYRSAEALTENPLGNITVTAGHWYKFEVSLTNTSGASGNYNAACALYDYGTDGLSPGTNIIGFSTLRSNAGQTIASSTAVSPALRAFQSAGIDAWDNFLVYTASSKPVFTQPLHDFSANAGQSFRLAVLAEGPQPITYAWYTNGAAVAGATGPVFATRPLTTNDTSIRVVASNANGSTTNTALLTVGVVTPARPPVLANTAATNITTTSSVAGGNVTSTGGEAPSVTIYYGTSDGGTNASAWASSVDLGPQKALFSQALAGLQSGTRYYFTAFGQNSGGSAWAASGSAR